MIFVLVIWVSFDFRPCKKKFKNIPAKKDLFEKGLWPYIFADTAWVSPRGTDKVVHVIKKYKLKKFENYFF